MKMVVVVMNGIKIVTNLFKSTVENFHVIGARLDSNGTIISVKKSRLIKFA